MYMCMSHPIVSHASLNRATCLALLSLTSQCSVIDLCAYQPLYADFNHARLAAQPGIRTYAVVPPALGTETEITAESPKG